VGKVMPDHCDELRTVFQAVQRVVQGSLDTLELPDMGLGERPYSLLLTLWSFHRVLVEALVLIESVRGQCACGRLAQDLTGSYWHLRDYFCVVLRKRRDMLMLLCVEAVLSPQVSVQTDSPSVYSYRFTTVAATA
jgi:hypothetical protein